MMTAIIITTPQSLSPVTYFIHGRVGRSDRVFLPPGRVASGLSLGVQAS